MVRRERGQALIETIIGIALLAAALAIWISWSQAQNASNANNLYGSRLSQMGVGLRGYIAAVQGGSATMPSNPYTVTGVAWLKPPTCGGLATNPTQGFVPCSFDGGPLGPSYTTTITQVPASNTIEARTWFFVPTPADGTAGLGAAAAFVANATLSQQTLPSNGTFLNAFANAPIAANAAVAPAAIAAADRGRVVLVVNNSPSNDVFLRVDGTNQMLADFNAGGHSIANAKDGSFTGNVHVAGTAQVDNGLAVTSGTADLRGGVLTPEVQVSSVGHMASQALYTAQVYTGQPSYTIPMPDCSKANLGTSSPGIYVALQGTGSPSASGGDAIYDAHVTVTTSGANWIVTPVVRTTTFSLGGQSVGNTLTINLNKSVATAAAADQTVLVMTKCK